MKIAFIGNLANNFYREAKALQGSSKISVDLYFFRNPEDSTRLPESDEPSLRNNYPAWIKTYGGVKTSLRTLFLFALGIKNPLEKLNQSIVDILNNYDLCIFSGGDVRLASLVKTKTFFRATGADLTVYPIFTYKQINELYPPQSRAVGLEALKSKVDWQLRRWQWKSAIRSCNYVNAGFGKPYEEALEKINISKSKVLRIFHLAIDVDVFQARTNKNEILERWKLSKFKFIVFLPSRLMLRDSQILRDTGQWKASDIAIYGFKHLLEKVKFDERDSIALVIPDRTQSPDLIMAKNIINESEISSNVSFISGKSDFGLTRDEMLDIYSVSDVVMDDFGVGWYGSCVVEALSIGVPVVTYVPDLVMQSMFPWSPIQSAKLPQEIGESLFKLHSDKGWAEKLGQDSRRWAIEFCSNEVIRKRLESELFRLASSD